MEEFLTEEDVTILDNILRILIDNNRFTHHDFIKIKGYESNYPIENVINDFLYYFNILSKNELLGNGGKLDYEKGIIELKPFGVKTENFYNCGGFKSKYKAQQILVQRREETEELSFKKLKKDTTLSNWQAKTFIPAIIFSFIGGLYSIYDITVKLKENKKDEGQKVVTKQQLDKEIATLRTLILDYKRADSLYRSNHFTSLSPKTK